MKMVEAGLKNRNKGITKAKEKGLHGGLGNLEGTHQQKKKKSSLTQGVRPEQTVRGGKRDVQTELAKRSTCPLTGFWKKKRKNLILLSNLAKTGSKKKSRIESVLTGRQVGRRELSMAKISMQRKCKTGGGTRVAFGGDRRGEGGNNNLASVEGGRVQKGGERKKERNSVPHKKKTRKGEEKDGGKKKITHKTQNVVARQTAAGQKKKAKT